MQVALALLQDPEGQHYGYELSKAAGVKSGVMYPLLRRMLDEGYLIDGWEDEKEISGRPVRRYYRLTDKGRTQLGGIIRSAQRDVRFRGLNLGTA